MARRRSPPARVRTVLERRFSGRSSLLAAVGLLCLFATAPASAHEPLWGETPITFGFGVIHPEVKYSYFDAGSTRSPGGKRMRMFEQEYMVDYGFSPRLNVRLMIPYHSNVLEERLGGRVRQAGIAGLGDITLRAKSRISARQEIGLSVLQSVFFGVKLPTGENDHRAPDGSRLDPHTQTGTGKPGILLGYAWDRETLADTTWVSVMWTRDLGGGFRMGDMVELDVAYGYWWKQQRTADDLGLNFAIGLHGEYHAADPMGGGRTFENSHALIGLQMTQMIIKRNHQFRFGVMLPFVRTGEQDHTAFPVEFRIAFETFF